ncbi:DUF6174 domain-containing protein [Gemmatimonas sp.]
MRHVVLFALLLAVGVAACDSATDALSPREVRELTAARARWNGSPLRNAYSYETRMACFCPPEVGQWHRVRVVNGAITDVRTEDATAVPVLQWTWYPTVDSLFAILVREPDEYVQDVSARYDQTHGYPLEISITARPGIADGGVTYFTRGLQPVP